MSLISLLLILIIFGVVLYLISLIPMDATVRRIIQVVAVLFVVLWVLDQIGLLAGFGNIRIHY